MDTSEPPRADMGEESFLSSFEVLSRESATTMEASTSSSTTFEGNWNMQNSTESELGADDMRTKDAEEMTKTLSSVLDELTSPYQNSYQTDTSKDEEEEEKQEFVETCDPEGPDRDIRDPSSLDGDADASSMGEDEEEVLIKSTRALDIARSQSSELLERCRQEHNRIKSMISHVNGQIPSISKSSASYNPFSGFVRVSAEDSHSAPSAEQNSKISTPLKSAEDSQFVIPTDVEPKSNNSISTPPKRHRRQLITPRTLIIAVLSGFFLSFLLFLSYTVVFESYRHQQLLRYENMTASERSQKEVYRQGEDNLREVLMHKSYEEARHSSDELQSCQKGLKESNSQISSLEKEILSLKYESRAKEESHLQKIQKLESDLINSRVKHGTQLKSNIQEVKNALKQLRDQNQELKWKWNFAVVALITAGIIGLTSICGRQRQRESCR